MFTTLYKSKRKYNNFFKFYINKWKWRNIKKIYIYNKTDYKFSVSFKIKNDYINNWIPNAINIKSVSDNFQNEFIFLPFTFFHVKDVKIDIKNHTAEIFLKTIGKKEILEMQIKNNKEIEYNTNENIIQIKRN